MARIHLFEFEDQKWSPAFLRNYRTDFLQFLSNKTKMYDLVKSLDKSESYSWEIGKLKSVPGIVLYLLGIEKDHKN